MKRQLPLIVSVTVFLILLNVAALSLAFNESGANYSAISLRTIINQTGSADQSLRRLKRVGFPYSAKGLLACAITFGMTLVISSLTLKAVASSVPNNDKSHADMLS